MTQETRTEVVVFTGLAVFLAGLWWLNRRGGAGTGLEDTPFFGDGGDPSSPGVAGNGPATFDIGGNSYVGPTFDNGSGLLTSPGSGGCGCSACQPSSGMVAFGTQADLLNYLAASGTPSASDIANWQ